jgi:hypothetical protein
MLTFRRLPDTPKVEYIVDVEQKRQGKLTDEKGHRSTWSKTDEKEHRRASITTHELAAVVGGISYEIHTDRDNIEP